jgi:uncharacterized membrane protein
MNMQLYELMLLFAIYSILGWVIQVLYFALTENQYDNRGVCAGPWCPSYGFAALLILFGASVLTRQYGVNFKEVGGLMAALVLGLVAGLISGLASKAVVNGLSGARIVHLRWEQMLLFAIGGALLICHIQPLMLVLIRGISPWVHLVFLLFFWVRLLSELVDGLAGLRAYKKKNHLSATTE